MTQIMGLISKLAAFALVIGVARAAEPRSLKRFVEDFNLIRSGMNSESRQVAELFGSLVGDNRRYRYEMKLGLPLYQVAQLAPVVEFIRSFGSLSQFGDGDAISETLTRVSPGVSQQELADKKRVAELVEATIKPACKSYVEQLQRLFDGDQFKEALAKGQLEREVAENGADQLVKDFLFGWAHYHACQMLLVADEKVIYRRAALRAPAYFEVKAKLQAQAQAKARGGSQ